MCRCFKLLAVPLGQNHQAVLVFISRSSVGVREEEEVNMQEVVEVKAEVRAVAVRWQEVSMMPVLCPLL
jgi:hypothetical protein